MGAGNDALRTGPGDPGHTCSVAEVDGASRHWQLESVRTAVPVIVMVLGAMALLLGMILHTDVGGIIFIPLTLIGIQLRLKHGRWRLPAKG